MSIHRFDPSSAVDEIRYITTEKGGMRAYLQARGGVSEEQLSKAAQALNEKRWQTVPFDLEGKPALEVRGFEKPGKLERVLEECGAVKGEPQIIKTPDDTISLGDKLRKRTLQASGAAYLIGDYGFWNYGKKEADKLTMAGSFFYFLGTLALLGYGRNDQSDIQVHDMAKDLEQFLGQKKVKLPEGCALHTVTTQKPRGMLKSLDETARRYPSELFNTATAMAGVFVAASAYTRKIKVKPNAHMDVKAIHEMRQEGWLDFGLGALTTASGVLATVVKEKKPDPDDPPAKGLNWAVQKVREHPLAIAGIGYTASTMCHAVSTVKAYREAKRLNDRQRLSSVPNRALFVGMAFLSEFLLTISSKGHGEGVTSDESVNKSTYAIAAEMIAKQKPPEREWHLQHVAGYLQRPEVMADSYENVERTLREEVAKLQNNPWLRQNAAKTGSDAAEEGGTPLKIAQTEQNAAEKSDTSPKKDTRPWRQRVAVNPEAKAVASPAA